MFNKANNASFMLEYDFPACCITSFASVAFIMMGVNRSVLPIPINTKLEWL